MYSSLRWARSTALRNDNHTMAHTAVDPAESRIMLRELEQQAIWRMQRWRVLRLLSGWRTYAQSCKAGRHCLQGMQLRSQRRRSALACCGTATVPCLRCIVVRCNLQGQTSCVQPAGCLLLTHCWCCNPPHQLSLHCHSPTQLKLCLLLGLFERSVEFPHHDFVVRNYDFAIPAGRQLPFKLGISWSDTACLCTR